MSEKSVNDYLTEGMYGVRLPKEEEREKFLGTFRERIVLALTIGQVMSDNAIKQLENTMKKHPNTKLLLNGQVDIRFLKKEKELAAKYEIPYSIINNTDIETDIGAVLTYEYAIDKENIYIEETLPQKEVSNNNQSTFLRKIKKWFS